MRLLVLLLALWSSQASGITAKSYIVTELDGTVIIQKDSEAVLPIASITKLFTVRSALAYNAGDLIQITEEDLRAGRSKTSILKAGSAYSRSDLMHLALIKSDNAAAIALGRTEHPPFVLPPSTRIVEASGLDPSNVSSAKDLARFASSLVNTELARISVKPYVTIGQHKKASTNTLIRSPKWVFHLSKTGFINQSGGCVLVIFESKGRLVTAVILGSRDVPARWRDLIELRKMIEHQKM